MGGQGGHMWPVDYSWLWSREDPTSQATLRVVLRSENSLRAMLRDFLDTLEQDSQGIYGCGGWALIVQSDEDECIIVDIIAAGQDIADAMEDGATRLYEAFGGNTGVDIRWHQRPKN